MPQNEYEITKDEHTRPEGEEERVFEDYLRRRGLKFTTVRRHLLRRIFEMHDHFTAEQLLDRLKGSEVRVSKATVYRTLSVMLECGLLESHDFGEGSLFYEHSFGHRHHDHLFCLHCKRIIEFRNERIEELQQEVAREFGFKMLSHALKIYGLCQECRGDEELVQRYQDPAHGLAQRT